MYWLFRHWMGGSMASRPAPDGVAFEALADLYRIEVGISFHHIEDLSLASYLRKIEKEK